MRLVMFVLLSAIICCVSGDNRIYASKIIRLQDLKVGTNTIIFDVKSDFYVSSSQSLEAKAYESLVTVYLAGTGVNLFDASSWKTVNGDKKSLFSDISGTTLTIVNNNTALPTYANPAIIYGVSSSPLSYVYDASSTINMRPTLTDPSDFYVTLLSTTGAMALNFYAKNGWFPTKISAGGCQEAQDDYYTLMSSAPAGGSQLSISEYASTLRVSGSTKLISFDASTVSKAAESDVYIGYRDTAVFTSQNYRMNNYGQQTQNTSVLYHCKHATFNVYVTGDVPADSSLSISVNDTTRRISGMNLAAQQYDLQGDGVHLQYSQTNSNTTGVMVKVYCSGTNGLISLLFVLLASKSIYESM